MSISTILLITVGVIVLIIVAMWVIGKYFLPNYPEQWAQLADDLHLENHNPKGIYFDIGGEIDGVQVSLDVVQQQYATSRGRGSRPWARVRASLEELPRYQVRARHQKIAQEMDYDIRMTGEDYFDGKYALYAPAAADLDTLIPPSVREALNSANPAVHIVEYTVFWTERGFNKHPQHLKAAVASCVSVAKAINQQKT